MARLHVSTVNRGSVTPSRRSRSEFEEDYDEDTPRANARKQARIMNGDDDSDDEDDEASGGAEVRSLVYV
jgi:hypothetical protein